MNILPQTESPLTDMKLHTQTTVKTGNIQIINNSMKEAWLSQNTVIILKEISIMCWMKAQLKEETMQLMGIVNYKRDK